MQRQAQRLQAFVGPGLRRLEVHKATTCHGQRGDGLMALARVAPGSMELVLLDPPFDSNLFDKALAAAALAVASGGFVYLEAPQALSLIHI